MLHRVVRLRLLLLLLVHHHLLLGKRGLLRMHHLRLHPVALGLGHSVRVGLHPVPVHHLGGLLGLGGLVHGKDISLLVGVRLDGRCVLKIPKVRAAVGGPVSRLPGSVRGGSGLGVAPGAWEAHAREGLAQTAAVALHRAGDGCGAKV